MGNTMKTLARHLIGVGAGAGVVTAAQAVVPGLGTAPDESLSQLLVAIFVAAYAVAEKLLKPIWQNWLGEDG